jgi:hypothetical protein
MLDGEAQQMTSNRMSYPSNPKHLTGLEYET